MEKRKYRFDSDRDEFPASKLKRSEKKIQIQVMRTWFFSTFQDPAHCTQYESAEGGYFFPKGAPYFAEDELRSEFEDIIPEKIIIELARKLDQECVDWVRQDNPF